MSTDGGASWVAWHAVPRPGQGWYNNTIWVDPTDANRMVVGGLDTSTDGGNTFTQSQPVAVRARSRHRRQPAIVEPVISTPAPCAPSIGATTAVSTRPASVDALGTPVVHRVGWSNLNNGLAITQFSGVGATATGAGAIYGGGTGGQQLTE